MNLKNKLWILVRVNLTILGGVLLGYHLRGDAVRIKDELSILDTKSLAEASHRLLTTFELHPMSKQIGQKLIAYDEAFRNRDFRAVYKLRSRRVQSIVPPGMAEEMFRAKAKEVLELHTTFITNVDNLETSKTDAYLIGRVAIKKGMSGELTHDGFLETWILEDGEYRQAEGGPWDQPGISVVRIATGD